MEKTFEELIEEKFSYDITKDGKYRLSNLELKILLQQVREATIAECEQYIDVNPEIALDFTRGREIKINIPTDRIKTEK